MIEKLTLTVWTKDGRRLSGTYPYLAALARLDTAAESGNLEDAHLEPSK